MTTHNKSLDGLRGIASLIVILFHMDSFFGLAFSSNNLYCQGYLWQWYRRLLDGNFAVCVFFVLSGYVLLLGFKKHDLYLSTSFAKRYFRLTPLVLFSTISAFVLQQTIGFHNKELSVFIGGHEWLHNEFSAKLTFLGAIHNGIISVYQGNTTYNGPLWTIRIELIGSFIIYAYASLFFKYKNINYITIFILILLVSIFQTDGIYLSLFIIGAFVLKNNIRLNKMLLIPVTIVTLYLACENEWTPEILWLSSHISYFSNTTISIISHTIAAIFSLLVLLSSNIAQTIFSNKIFTFLGKVSFSMYVLHLLIIMSVGTYIINYAYIHHYNVNLFAGLSIMFSLCLTMLIAYITYILIDKPSSKFASIIVNKILLKNKENIHL